MELGDDRCSPQRRDHHQNRSHRYLVPSHDSQSFWVAIIYSNCGYGIKISRPQRSSTTHAHAPLSPLPATTRTLQKTFLPMRLSPSATPRPGRRCFNREAVATAAIPPRPTTAGRAHSGHVKYFNAKKGKSCQGDHSRSGSTQPNPIAYPLQNAFSHTIQTLPNYPNCGYEIISKENSIILSPAPKT